MIVRKEDGLGRDLMTSQQLKVRWKKPKTKRKNDAEVAANKEEENRLFHESQRRVL